MVNLTLPPFAWVMDGGHDGHLLEGRNVILHIRSMGIIDSLVYCCDRAKEYIETLRIELQEYYNNTQFQ